MAKMKCRDPEKRGVHTPKVKPLIPRWRPLLPVVALGFLIQPSIGGFLWVDAERFSGLLSLTKPKVPFSVQT